MRRMNREAVREPEANYRSVPMRMSMHVCVVPGTRRSVRQRSAQDKNQGSEYSRQCSHDVVPIKLPDRGSGYRISRVRVVRNCFNM